jgi:putative acetyltransferase
MQIRPETPADYAAIADLHIRAFDNRSDEAVLVALSRQRLSYEPELSLVAEIEGRVVGHALFTPCTIMLNSEAVRAVLLAPIGVHPDFQKQGIGGKLIEVGHDIARKKGFPLSFLIGHSTYYPRFGYQTKAFGSSSLEVQVSDLSGRNLRHRSPLAEDIPALMALWEYEESAINFSIKPDAHLSDWLTAHPRMQAFVYLKKDELVGYSRGNTEDVKMFLAQDDKVAQRMAKTIAGDSETLKLPLHPHSASFGVFNSEAEVRVWEAAMVCPLLDNAPLPQKDDLVGRPLWSSAFDLF